MYRGKGCMKRFCEFLREHAVKIINLKKIKMKLLTKEQPESYGNAKICYICQKKIENKYLKDKKYHQARDHCHYTRNIEVLCIAYVIQSIVCLKNSYSFS